MLYKFLLILSIGSIFFSEYVDVFTYMDEIFSITLFVIGLFKFSKLSKKGISVFTKLETTSFILLVLIIFLGVLSSFFSNINNQFFLQSYSLFGTIKYALIYFGVRVIFFNVSYSKYKVTSSFFVKLSYILNMLFVVMFFLDLVLNFMRGHGVRFFDLKSVAYGFGHPSEFALFIIVLSVLNLYFNIKNRKRIDYLFLLSTLFLIFTTGRVTAISFFILLIVLLLSYRFFRKYVFAGLIISLLSVLIFAGDKIVETFINMEAARGILMNAAIMIGIDFFPLGSGLGTFGSHASRINYSELYYTYGISNFYGLSETFSSFITDSYWAMFIGEFGFIAAILNLTCLILFALNSYSVNKGIIGIVISYIFIYMIVTSPIDTIILSNSILPLMFVSGLLVSFEVSNNINEKFNGK